MDEVIARVAQAIAAAERILVITGAGLSADSGLPTYRGLIKTYQPAFTPARHEALGEQDLLMARYRADGVLVPA